MIPHMANNKHIGIIKAGYFGDPIYLPTPPTYSAIMHCSGRDNKIDYFHCNVDVVT